MAPTSRDTVPRSNDTELHADTNITSYGVTHGLRIILSVATEAGGFSKRSFHAIRQVSSTRENFHLEVYASDQ